MARFAYTVEGALIVFFKIVFNAYLHPLSKFPGPTTAAISNVSDIT